MGRRSIFSIALLVGMLATGCSKKVDDAGLATQIKSEMFSDAQLNGASLEVTSKNGQVTLSGTVPNDAARYRAYKIANETAGVVKVNDQMTMLAAPPPSTQAAAASAPPLEPANSAPERAGKPRKVQKSSSPSPPDANSESADGAAAPPEQPEVTPPVAAQAQPVAAQVPAAPQPALPQPPPEPQPPQPKQVSIPADSTLTVRMIDGVDSAVNNAGEIFHASLEVPIVVEDDVVVPRGTDIYVRLLNASSAGRMSGKSELHLEL
jgi:hypothetical protein